MVKKWLFELYPLNSKQLLALEYVIIKSTTHKDQILKPPRIKIVQQWKNRNSNYSKHLNELLKVSNYDHTHYILS